jgi:hypothetical protein
VYPPTPGNEVCHDGWFPCPLHSHKVKGKGREGTGGTSFETIISFVICLAHSINFDLLHGKNLSWYCFSTSIFMNHFVHTQQTLCLLVIIFTMSSSNFLSYFLTGFGALFQPFSKLFARWDKQVISKLQFFCALPCQILCECQLRMQLKCEWMVRKSITFWNMPWKNQLPI